MKRIAFVALGAVLALGACGEQQQSETTTEPAAATQDTQTPGAMDQATDAAKDAGKATMDAAKSAGEAVGDAAKGAGEAVGDAAKSAGDAVKEAMPSTGGTDSTGNAPSGGGDSAPAQEAPKDL